MNYRSITVRMLAAALLPVVVAVVTISGALWFAHVSDIDQAHAVRARLLLRQTALASEYGLFSGNAAVLQGIVNAVRKEADVSSVAVYDRSGIPIAYAGEMEFGRLAEIRLDSYQQSMRSRGIDVLLQTVTTPSVQVEDLYGTTDRLQGENASQVLGFVALKVSRETLQKRGVQALWLAMGIGGLGMLMGGVFALRLGRRVVDPILRVSADIQRIGNGDFSGSALSPDDPLHDVQQKLNEMALRLAWGREEMEQRVVQATREIRLKQEEAETATLAKSRFLAAASHDLRQPAHAMGMFIARLNQLPLDATTRELANGLDASVRAMQMLLDGLLDISRLESGTVQPQMQSTDLGSLLNAIRQACEPQANSKGLALRLAPTQLWAMTDPVLLQRMVANLVHNAVTYTQQGSILITCRPTGQGTEVRIDVSDSGIGIAHEHQQVIFNEFYQVSNPGRDRGKGMGLGLNIVERSARLLGHRVHVRSHPGCGSRFSISMERSQPVEQLDKELLLPDRIENDLVGLRVLVIDDDTLALNAIQMLLESWGCVVYAAPTAPAARDLLDGAFEPDFIVSDYRLGDGVSGIQAISDVRVLLSRPVPACLISGDTDVALIRQAHDSALTLLHKPVRPAKLRSLMRRLAIERQTG